MMKQEDGFDERRRLFLIRALAAGLFASGFHARAFADSVFGRPAKLPPGQSIYKITGSVLVNGQPATLQTPVGPNDTVRTGKNSEAIFVVGGHSMIVRADSELRMSGDRNEEGSAILTGLRMLTGALLSVSRKQPMNVNTPTATIGIRGTGFYLEAEPERTYFCTCYGQTVAFASEDPGSKQEVVSEHHDMPLYILKGEQPGQNIRPAPFINHTDQELMLIETLVGRETPFAFAGDEYSAPRRDY